MDNLIVSVVGNSLTNALLMTKSILKAIDNK